jgi:hypothetical protein
MQTIILKSNYYYYNDGKDNDFDYFNTNRDSLGGRPVVQRTIWVDTNGNDAIDWVEPGNPANAFNITDLIRIIRTDPAYQNNPLFQQYGRYIAVDSTTTDDKHFIFTGPNGGEFVAGDWGVDEESLDDVDNDQDGFKDEDSRIAKDTLDQDGDFIDIDTLAFDDSLHGSGKFATAGPYAGKNLARLIWVDDNVDGRISAPDGTPITRQYVLDSIAAITAAVNSGMGYGEWIAGDWGVDEEYVDGIDNDGDGLVDEDGDIHLIHRSEFWPRSTRDRYMDSLKIWIDLNDITK